jgi:ABC-type sulfate transport system permease component
MPPPGNRHRRMTPMKTDAFKILMVFSSITILAFIFIPLIDMVTSPSLADLWESISDPDVRNAIGLSLYTSAWAAVISLAAGHPVGLPFGPQRVQRQKAFGKRG